MPSSAVLSLAVVLVTGPVAAPAATAPAAPSGTAAALAPPVGPPIPKGVPPLPASGGAPGAKSPAAPTKPAAAKPTSSKRPKAPRWPTIVLFHVNRRETLRFRLADDQGRPVRGVQARMNRFLRCHQTNKQASINARLLRLIYETGRHYPGKRISVVSGYRHPTVAKNRRSPHMKGLACDLRVDGVKNTELRDYFRATFKKVGVGYYPNSSFVHLDVRNGPSAFWIDYSGPGQNAIYSENPTEDLRSGRADSWKPAKIDPTWVDEDDPEGGDGASGSLAAGARTPAPAPTP